MTDRETALARFRQLVRMRHFDEACLEGVPTGEIHGELHVGIGQEAIGAGIAEALRPEDAVVSTHRNHFHGLAKGVDERALLAEIYEKETGLCRGRGGHMHPFEAATNFSATGIVGASLPVALGHAYAFRIQGREAIALGVAGDGAVNTGGFHETMNIAGVWKLPLVVLIENNQYAMGTSTKRASKSPNLWERGAAYGIPGEEVDGMDVLAVKAAGDKAVKHCRAGKGPYILEIKTYRYRGHSMSDPAKYRTREEVQKMREERDPIEQVRQLLLTGDHASEDDLKAIDKEIKETVNAAAEFAKESPEPDLKELWTDIYAEEIPQGEAV